MDARDRLTEVPFAAILAEVRRCRTTPCPNCEGTNHHPVDIDGEGEYRRHCQDCGTTFRIEEAIR
jgi:transposase-like protein